MLTTLHARRDEGSRSAEVSIGSRVRCGDACEPIAGPCSPERLIRPIRALAVASSNELVGGKSRVPRTRLGLN